MSRTNRKPNRKPKSSSKKLNLRALAALLLAEILDKKHSLTEKLPHYKEKCLNDADSALLQAFVFGALRFYPRFEYIAGKIIAKPFKATDTILLHLMILGMFQLSLLRVPDHAAISETVEACRQLKKPWAVPFMNAALREFQRKMQHYLEEVAKMPEWYAHPPWMYERIKHDWPDNYLDILSENNIEAPLTLRVNEQKIGVTECQNSLLQNNIASVSLQFPPSALSLETPCDTTSLALFKEGYISIQDAASQCAAFLLELTPEIKVLDAASAPGGKTCHILEKCPSAFVFSVDVSKTRADKIKENLKRLHLKAKVIVENIQNLPHTMPSEYFDRILLDAPCSAMGVIRRHPDIKYLRTQEDIDRLAKMQLTYLQTLWQLLKPGGILLYATCSILKAENEDVIEKFLNYQRNAIPYPIPFDIGIQQKVGTQIFPGQNGMDGFYFARIKKN